ncbi:Pentatricopeptide repeat-containing protein [Capsicum baccatum]|uniref:Pentatricopeptide repeat-containing protein n=1 Tax=Capsicum baccatum TaxID=33114 RepID=A0A2G2VR53_CAPBA|nr:Pentatricopeptide repeat-containing protein [Capsicum baccatum]
MWETWVARVHSREVLVRGEGNAPDEITFFGAILACTHGGMVQKAGNSSKVMERRFSIAPKLEYYGCMVDLLGQAGKLEEAYDLIQSMIMLYGELCLEPAVSMAILNWLNKQSNSFLC